MTVVTADSDREGDVDDVLGHVVVKIAEGQFFTIGPGWRLTRAWRLLVGHALEYAQMPRSRD